MTTPTPGQPLSEADVSLLQPGDRLKWRADRAHYGTFLHRMDDVSAGICWHSDVYNQPHYSPGFMMEFVKRPAPPKEDLGDGVSRDVEPEEAYRPHAPVSRPAGEGEREAVARVTGDDLHAQDLRKEIQSLLDCTFASKYRDGTDEPPCLTAVLTEEEGSDLADAILSLLSPAAPDAGGGWMPIERAPKDGTEVLVLIREKVIRLGWYFKPSSRTEGWRDENGKSIRPTHWMPLPAPPALQPGGER